MMFPENFRHSISGAELAEHQNSTNQLTNQPTIHTRKQGQVEMLNRQFVMCG